MRRRVTGKGGGGMSKSHSLSPLSVEVERYVLCCVVARWSLDVTEQWGLLCVARDRAVTRRLVAQIRVPRGRGPGDPESKGARQPRARGRCPLC
eukprot:2988267-Rhodomonas_salina.1